MKELNELVERSNEIAAFYDNSIVVDNKTILAIAEAFRALEQRAEAAEAKLAELEKQEPKLAYIRRLESELAQLRTRPTPAINLAELVPDAIDGSQVASRYPSGWNACRAAILRNIEEAK